MATSELFVILEGSEASGACGYTSSIVVIPVDNCDIQPSTPAQWPYGITYLMAHELTHALGAVSSCAPNSIPGGHLDDDNRDILYQGSGGRDWNNLMLDPGRDDYLGDAQRTCSDIRDHPAFGTWAANQPGGDGTEICFGREATLVGTDGDDVLTGTSGADVIVGLGGNDKIYALGGHDVICAGSGRDFIWAGDGNDQVDSGDGNDKMWGERGRDVLYGYAGRDVLVGGAGYDTLFGGGGDDRIAGNVGNDTLVGGSGHDRMYGGPNNDSIQGGSGNDQLWGGDDVDNLNGGRNTDTCTQANGGSIIKCE